MKKYTSRATRRLGIAAMIFGLIFLVGIILAIAKTPDIALPIGLIFLGGLLGVIFFACYFAEKSRYLIIEPDKIILPRGVIQNEITKFKRTIVMFDEISSVESKFHKGDQIISGDCFFHTLKLKDGTNITFPLYHYGKEAEKEIIETIKNSMV